MFQSSKTTWFFLNLKKLFFANNFKLILLVDFKLWSNLKSLNLLLSNWIFPFQDQKNIIFGNTYLRTVEFRRINKFTACCCRWLLRWFIFVSWKFRWCHWCWNYTDEREERKETQLIIISQDY